jgi:hypothetical protein
MQMPFAFRKIPPAEAFKGFFVAAPSMFTFIQDIIGGDQITSLMLGAKLEHISSSRSVSIVTSNRGLRNYETYKRFPLEKKVGQIY